MGVDKRAIIERIVSSGEIDRAEQLEELRLRRIATWDAPMIEYAFQDIESLATFALFFPDINGNVEGWLEDALQALSFYDSCIVCLPASSLQDANAFCNYISEKGLDLLQIGVVVYDNTNQIVIIRMYIKSDTSSKRRTTNEKKSYWCWWRDASQYEVATLLELSEKYDDLDEDIYTEKVYPKFYDMMINGETKQWDGKPRKKNYSEASFKAEKQNYKIPLCQLGLWDSATGHITQKGRKLLSTAKRYGSDSEEYLKTLTKIILLDGKHLDLIKDLDDFQRNCSELIPESSAEYFVIFDNYMEDKGSIGTRKPSAVTTGAKNAYIRDEAKLWNKLNLVIPSGKGRYYWPFEGVKFNWERINSILVYTD